MYQITLVTQNTPRSLAVKDVMKMEHSPWNHYIIDNSAWFWITFSWWLVNPSLNFNPASLRCLYTVLKYKLSTYVGHIHAFLAENMSNSPSIYPIQLTVFLAALTKFYQMIIEN